MTLLAIVAIHTATNEPPKVRQVMNKIHRNVGAQRGGSARLVHSQLPSQLPSQLRSQSHSQLQCQVQSELDTMNGEMTNDQDFLAALKTRCDAKKKEFEQLLAAISSKVNLFPLLSKATSSPLSQSLHDQSNKLVGNQ